MKKIQHCPLRLAPNLLMVIVYTICNVSLNLSCYETYDKGMHLGTHDYLVIVGHYCDSLEQKNSLLIEKVEHTPTPTSSIIVLEAIKELSNKMLLTAKGAQQKTFKLDELLPLFDRCKHMSLPNVFYLVL